MTVLIWVGDKRLEDRMPNDVMPEIGIEVLRQGPMRTTIYRTTTNSLVAVRAGAVQLSAAPQSQAAPSCLAQEWPGRCQP